MCSRGIEEGRGVMGVRGVEEQVVEEEEGGRERGAT